MSLLSGLLDGLPPPAAASRPNPTKSPVDRPLLTLIERDSRQTTSARTYTHAAKASPEWRRARDQYVNHVMTCRNCSMPTGRHCPAGADLRITYDQTPMEIPQ
ncbi:MULTISPECIES: hypothetical protein [Pseudomonas syringae group]|uniref:Uncharacterized protein n=2 Tax=Pseudomonas syringae group TaxID=136849 RepID=A0A0P9L5C0_PSECA|nr:MULTISPECIES: hypothetical protein [Pseudomonas syringae group]EGH20562.1 hypothetical protein PSYMO_03298 [Pseudomonas amygdali pv. mori str. 301020]KAA8699648.1 hypothetical protein F4W70_26560 [Pseudomonas cannabina]KPW64743.1 hypothetical protein ALO81_101271 [Pseudomonas cannabina]RMN32694.1 hypothetical protein ALQ64_101387 [Pseudomonas cannabina]UPT36225.1 hypothetical protein LT107_23060 [Pseudomonas amygdali pv. loropetali]